MCIIKFKGRNTIQTNKKKQKSTVIYEGTKKTPNIQKGHNRASKKQKNSWVPLLKCVFCCFSDQITFFQFFERVDAFECWMHKCSD